MDQTELKWTELDPSGENWTKMDQTRLVGPKCYTDKAQHDCNNNKCYASIFRFYIDKECISRSQSMEIKNT